MKYKITIEGGFTGIPKEYEGDIELNEAERNVLVCTMDTPVQPLNKKMRDGFLYRLKLADRDETFHMVFDDSNLPVQVREFIDMARQKSK